MNKPFKLRDRAGSFRHAFRGIRMLFSSQHNAWVHAAALVLALTTSWVLPLTRWEWGLVIFAITIVLVAEAMNTAVEALADALVPEIHPQIQIAKDVAAGAVLLASIGAIAIGTLVFGPYLLA
jgi:diacylglycerol kinase (ATP)